MANAYSMNIRKKYCFRTGANFSKKLALVNPIDYICVSRVSEVLLLLSRIVNDSSELGGKGCVCSFRGERGERKGRSECL
jgi:hypothetical protein